LLGLMRGVMGCGLSLLFFALSVSDALAAPMPIAPGGLAAIPSDEADVRLDWQPVGVDIYGDAADVAGYRVYASTNPRFAPDFDAQGNLLAEVNGTSFVHSNAVASATNLFYYVTAVTTNGTESLVVSEQLFAQRTDIACPPGEQRFAWMAVTESILATNAAELAAELGPVDRVYRFRHGDQTHDEWDVGEETGTNFHVTVGDVVAVRFTGDATLTFLGRQATPSQAFDWTYVPARFNRHWVSFPPNSPVADAAGVVATIPHSTKAARFDTESEAFESWFLLGGIWQGTNFPVRPGEPVQVSIATNSAWKMPSLYPEVAVGVENGIGFIDLQDMVATGTVASGASPIVEYAWDYDGDGVFDNIDDIPVPEVRQTLAAAGSVRPTLRVRNADGFYAVAHAPYTGLALDMAFSNQAFHAGLNETGTVSYTVSHAGEFSVYIYDADGNLVRTLEDGVAHEAGEVLLDWDGRDNEGNLVEPGAYHVVVEQTVNGQTLVYNTADLTRGQSVNQSITAVSTPGTFSLAEGGAFPIQFTLETAAMVTVEILDSGGSNIATVVSNDLRGVGMHYLSWDGRIADGSVIAEGTAFSVAISAVGLGDNAMIVQAPTPVLSGLQTASRKFTPSENPYGTEGGGLKIAYTLDMAADVRLLIRNQDGTVMLDALEPGKTAGTHESVWPGADGESRLVAKGFYSITAIPQSGGQNGISTTVWAEAFY